MYWHISLLRSFRITLSFRCKDCCNCEGSRAAKHNVTRNLGITNLRGEVKGGAQQDKGNMLLKSRRSHQSNANILSEVLNTDVRSLSDLLDLLDRRGESESDSKSEPTQVNALGSCGESPLHVAIYKRHEELTSLLLVRGKACPNRYNARGETAVHLAARLGWQLGLEACYATGRCELGLRTTDGFTALDIAEQPPSTEDATLAQKFGLWEGSRRLSEEFEYLRAGRQACATYLRKVWALDNDMHCRKLVEDAVSAQDTLSKQMRIFNRAEFQYRGRYGEGMPYPHGMDSNKWTPHELELFVNNHESVHEVAVTNFAHSFGSTSVHKGFLQAQLIQRRKESALDLDS